MDGVSAAASIIGIATAGIQISIKLITFSNQVGTAPSRIRNIGNDVSLTSGVLQQLGDLMKAKISDDETSSIFSPSGLQSTKASAEACDGVFRELKHALERASKQIRTNTNSLGEKVTLSKTERLKWPFLQPGFDDLRSDLRDSRETLMLILQVTTLAYSKKLAELNKPTTLTPNEQSELISAILAMQKPSVNSKPDKDEQPESEVGEQDERRPSDREESRSPSRTPSLEVEPLGNVEKGTQTNFLESSSPQRASADHSSEDRRNSIIVAENIDSSRGESGITKFAKNSDHAIEAWIVVPVIVTAFGGYNLRWEVHVLPLRHEEVAKQLRRMQRWKMSSISEQLGALDNEEREALNFHITQSSMNSHRTTSQVSLLAVGRKKIPSPKRSLGLKSCHCVNVIVERRFLQLQGHADKRVLENRTEPESHRISKVVSLSRPTYIKVHRKHLSPATLDAYQLPWEWDHRDSNYIIIRQWIPEPEQNILFEHTKRSRESGLLNNTTVELNEEEDNLLLGTKKPSTRSESRQEVRVEDDNRTSPTEEPWLVRSAAPYSHEFHDSTSDPEASSQKIVNDLLEKYTTLYSGES